MLLINTDLLIFSRYRSLRLQSVFLVDLFNSLPQRISFSGKRAFDAHKIKYNLYIASLVNCTGMLLLHDNVKLSIARISQERNWALIMEVLTPTPHLTLNLIIIFKSIETFLLEEKQFLNCEKVKTEKNCYL